MDGGLLTDPATVLERISERLVPDKNGCWNWAGCCSAGGYGQLRRNNTTLYVHRVVYSLARGELVKGMHVDHLCRNPRCANPYHLEQVTVRENILRGASGALKTHCKNGHPWTEENKLKKRDGKHRCRICHRDAERERKRREREQAA